MKTAEIIFKNGDGTKTCTIKITPGTDATDVDMAFVPDIYPGDLELEDNYFALLAIEYAGHLNDIWGIEDVDVDFVDD